MAVVTVFLQFLLQRLHLLAEHSLLPLHLGDQFVSVLQLPLHLGDQFVSMCQMLLQLLLVSSQLDQFVFGSHRLTVPTCIDFDKSSRTPGLLQSKLYSQNERIET